MTGNIIGSPISVDIVLAMATYGADGNTQNELRRGLHFPDDLNEAANGYQSIIDDLNVRIRQFN